MERRALLKDLILIAGGITFLPACRSKSGKASIALKNIEVSAEEEILLADIADTIIPKTDTPGAKESGSHLFVLRMLDDCYEENDQQQFMTGLKELDKLARERFGRTFIKCNAAEKAILLQALEEEKNLSPELSRFYTIMKQKTIQGYMTSRYVVRDIMKYEMVPSVPYNGYHLIKNKKDHGRQS